MGADSNLLSACTAICLPPPCTACFPCTAAFLAALVCLGSRGFASAPWPRHHSSMAGPVSLLQVVEHDGLPYYMYELTRHRLVAATATGGWQRVGPSTRRVVNVAGCTEHRYCHRCMGSQLQGSNLVPCSAIGGAA